MDTMRAIAFQSPNTVELIQMDIPKPEPGWARIRVRAAGICMTDFEVLHGRIDASYPLVPGHEWSGVVDAVGSPAHQSWLGRKVVGDNELVCLECVYCRRSEWRRCGKYRQIGFRASGAYAEYLVVPIRNLHELAKNVSFEQGALLEPLGVGLAVAAMAQCRAGSTAVVLGAGPIGLNCLASLKASGAIQILCLDRRRPRLDVALSWGASAAFDNLDDLTGEVAWRHPEGTNIVVDTTGSVEIVKAGIPLACFGGTVVLAGYCGGKSVDIRLDEISSRNVRVVGAGNNSGFTAVAARCVAAGLLRTESMITHRFELKDYRTALSPDTITMPGFVKAVLIP